VILAGDIHIGIKGLIWAREHFKQPIIYVPGNHEYYRNSYQKLNKQLKDKANELNIHLLMDSSVMIDEVLFVGATLWTDFKLYHTQYNSQLAAQFDMSDYKFIRYNQGGKYRKLTPPDTTRMHIQSLQFIKSRSRHLIRVLDNHPLNVSNKSSFILTAASPLYGFPSGDLTFNARQNSSALSTLPLLASFSKFSAQDRDFLAPDLASSDKDNNVSQTLLKPFFSDDITLFPY